MAGRNRRTAPTWLFVDHARAIRRLRFLPRAARRRLKTGIRAAPSRATPVSSDAAPTSTVVWKPPPRPVKAMDPGLAEPEPGDVVALVAPDPDGDDAEDPVVNAVVRARW